MEMPFQTKKMLVLFAVASCAAVFCTTLRADTTITLPAVRHQLKAIHTNDTWKDELAILALFVAKRLPSYVNSNKILCITDGTLSHVRLLINALLGMASRGCDGVAAICYDLEVAQILPKIGVRALYDPTTEQSLQRLLPNTPQCRTWLLRPMYIRSKFVAALALANISFFLADSDTFLLQDVHTLLRPSPGMGAIFVSSHLLQAPGWSYPFWACCNTTHGTLNNGVMGLVTSKQSTQVVLDWYLKSCMPNVCELGFAQTTFNRYMWEHGLRLSPGPNQSDVAKGTVGSVEVTISTGVKSEQGKAGIGLPFLVHAVGQSSGNTAPNREKWLKKHQAWVLGHLNFSTIPHTRSFARFRRFHDCRMTRVPGCPENHPP